MLIIILLLLDLLKENAYAADVSVYCPDNGFMDNTDTYLTGSFNSSVISTGKCAYNVSIVNFVFTKGTSNPVLLCTQPFSTSPLMCNTNYTTQNCKCDNVTGEMFYYTYRFTTNANVHEGGVIELTTDCEVRIGDEPLTVETCSVKFKTTTPYIPTTIPTIYISETTTQVPDCEKCNCTGKCRCPDNCSKIEKCPVWCIIVSVCVPCAILGIILITVIIIKKKKAKAPGNSEGGRNGTKLAVQDTKEMQDKTKHRGTENRLKPAQAGSHQAEESVQDTKEMQDKSKHLGTENSPEREKRRKKKKKKKPFQEVDGETVSRENKSTVNDHKAAQNDNSVSVNENSPITYNGELRSLPMPKTPHLTSVERNSTIFQSETPRKLPPLQPKAMIIP